MPIFTKEKYTHGDLSAMSSDELRELANVLRQELIEDVSRTGGHLASNLGAVELTIALHRVFDAEKDRIVWDVGHQSYVHKMLSGRRYRMDSLRQLDGLSGFPKRRESVCDAYDSGHSGTSVSAALGYACARDLKHEDYSCVAVIGDGAMTGGVSFEALNAAGSLKTSLIVVLNDNAMSISANVGGLSKHLQSVRSNASYLRFKSGVKSALKNSPKVLNKLSSIRDAVKYAIIPGVIFEELGFKYFGPVDGHDIDAVCGALEAAKKLGRPVLVHCVTKKGKGFGPAESNPEKYHGTGPFDPKTADDVTVRNDSAWSEVFGKILLDEAYADKRICAVTAAMTEGTGLSAMKRQLPERVFDAGIAEQHAVSFAAGLALNGMKPVVAIYSTFLQRAYDQVITEVCLQNLPVVFAVDRAGVVGSDGETHHGIFDIGYLMTMPNMTVLSPRDESELRNMMKYAFRLGTPCAVRYPRGKAPSFELQGISGDAGYVPAPEKVVSGRDCVVISDGSMLGEAIDAAALLSGKGVSCEVWDIKTIKPLNEEFLSYIDANFKKAVTIEDGCRDSGFGMRIAAMMKKADVLNLGWPQKFIEQGTQSQLKERYGLTAASIARITENFLEDKA